MRRIGANVSGVHCHNACWINILNVTMVSAGFVDHGAAAPGAAPDAARGGVPIACRVTGAPFRVDYSGRPGSRGGHRSADALARVISARIHSGPVPGSREIEEPHWPVHRPPCGP